VLIAQEGTAIPAGLIQNFTFIAFLVGFGAKLPTFPFHTWLPDAHVEAPTGGSVMLAGVLLKLGGYGLFRVNVQMLPQAAFDLVWVVAGLGVFSIVYGAIVCIAQDDLKRLVAFSSISHMGFVTLGLAAGVYGAGVATADQAGIEIGFSGAVFQMFAHGLISAALFMIAGSLGHKLGTRNVSELGGIAKKQPVMTTFLIIAFLASLGLPGLVGFVAEISVFIGTYAAFGWLILIPVISVVLTAAYYMWAAQRAVFGPLNTRWESVGDAHVFEKVPLAVLSVLFVIFGILPFLFFDVVHHWTVTFGLLGVG
jgi:proton-translocating NADH-quinone oxidoreductase chain M